MDSLGKSLSPMVPTPKSSLDRFLRHVDSPVRPQTLPFACFAVTMLGATYRSELEPPIEPVVVGKKRVPT